MTEPLSAEDEQGMERHRVCFVMRNLNSEPASGNVYIWSDRPSFVFLEWHKMWWAVKDSLG